jgi:hypothetical protein
MVSSCAFHLDIPSAGQGEVGDDYCLAAFTRRWLAGLSSG